MSRSSLLAEAILAVTVLATIPSLANSFPAFGDRIVPLKRQAIQASVASSFNKHDVSPLTSGFIPSPVRYERSFLKQREDEKLPLKSNVHQVSRNISPKRRSATSIPTPITKRKDIDVENEALFVPISNILAAPVPVQRGRKSKSADVILRKLKNPESRPAAPIGRARKNKPAEYRVSPVRSSDFAVSENREALTIVPAPDLTKERGSRALQFATNAVSITFQPSRALASSNDNFFGLKNNDEGNRRAVAPASPAAGSSSLKDDDDSSFFEDDDDDADEPSWVKPIFGRNGRAIERSSFFNLDSETSRYFSKPSDDDDDYALSDAVDVQPSSYSANGVPIYVSSASTYGSKVQQLPAYARPQPIPVATVYASKPEYTGRPQYSQPLPLEPARPAYSSHHGHETGYQDYGTSHQPEYAPHEPVHDGPSQSYSGGYDPEPEYSSGPVSDLASHSYPDVALDIPDAPHGFPAVVDDGYHAPKYGNEVAYGAETGNYGAFSYYVDIPVGCSGKYDC